MREHKSADIQIQNIHTLIYQKIFEKQKRCLFFFMQVLSQIYRFKDICLQMNIEYLFQHMYNLTNLWYSYYQTKQSMTYDMLPANECNSFKTLFKIHIFLALDCLVYLVIYMYFKIILFILNPKPLIFAHSYLPNFKL